MSFRCLIYGLVDPSDESREIRYVGRSSSGLRRPWKKHSARCASWMLSLRKRGLRAVVWVLERLADDASDAALNAAEVAWIARKRAAGCRLTNLTDGGEGLWNPSPEVRRRLSESHRGKKHTLSTREKMAAAHRGRKHAWHKRKLPLPRVMEMVARYQAGGVSQRGLAREFGINCSQACRLLKQFGGPDQKVQVGA